MLVSCHSREREKLCSSIFRGMLDLTMCAAIFIRGGGKCVSHPIKFTLLLSSLLFACLMPDYALCDEEDVTFAITGFEIVGNTVLAESELKEALRSHIGEKKTAEDVEKARDSLEALYHEKGYPTVLVNIPEQTVDKGIIGLEVIESRIRRVRVKGNRYFTMENLLKRLPSVREGELLYIPHVKEDLIRINRNPDIKVSPMLTPAREPGMIDVELNVKDELPLHGSLELNNRNTHDTTALRVNGMLRYDNLWQKEHSVSFQFQTSPQDLEEVQVLAGSYVLPSPLEEDHLLALYGVWSDSETAFGEGFQTIGKGSIFGLRYVMPLPPQGLYNHNLTVGLDYKDFQETMGFEGADGSKTPLTYMPLSFSYSASLPDTLGLTQFSASLNMSFRGLVSDQEEFDIKRYKARGDYLYATLGVERNHKLPAGLGLFMKLDGQIADQPLVSNEQYAAGGMESVRGYKETEAMGDDALHGSVELQSPDVAGLLHLDLGGKIYCTPYIFYDFARLEIKDPLPEQDRAIRLQGTGAGLRGRVGSHFEYQLDWGIALDKTDQVDKGDSEIVFKAKYRF